MAITMTIIASGLWGYMVVRTFGLEWWTLILSVAGGAVIGVLCSHAFK